MIRLEKVSKKYPNTEGYAVSEMSLEVEEGKLAVLIGESGCGKTTTLKMINRLIEPSSGQIFINEEDTMSMDPVGLRRHIGYVFQGIGLFPHYTIGENIGAVPKLLGWSKQEIDERVDEMMNLVSLDPSIYRERVPSALSGGQQQRVGVARALAARPRVMLLDEPFGALDPVTRGELQDEFVKIQEDLNLTAVMVTHDMTEALLMADTIAVMKEGELLQVGTPHELLAEPEHEYVQTMVEMPKRRADRLEELIASEG